MAYATLADLRQYLGLSSTADDALLQSLLEAASTIIDRTTSRTFAAAADSTRWLCDANIHGATLHLGEDVASITTIVNGDGATIAPTQYRTHPRNATPYYALEILPAADVAWQAAPDEIAITGRWAWSVEPPADIAFAAVRLAAYLYRQKDTQAPIDTGTLNRAALPTELPPDVMVILANYRRWGR